MFGFLQMLCTCILPPGCSVSCQLESAGPESAVFLSDESPGKRGNVGRSVSLSTIIFLSLPLYFASCVFCCLSLHFSEFSPAFLYILSSSRLSRCAFISVSFCISLSLFLLISVSLTLLCITHMVVCRCISPHFSQLLAPYFSWSLRACLSLLCLSLCACLPF